MARLSRYEDGGTKMKHELVTVTVTAERSCHSCAQEGAPEGSPHVLPDVKNAGVKISWWMWIKFIFMVAIPNIGPILNNLPSRVDPRLENRRGGFFKHAKPLTKVCPFLLSSFYS